MFIYSKLKDIKINIKLIEIKIIFPNGSLQQQSKILIVLSRKIFIDNENYLRKKIIQIYQNKIVQNDTNDPATTHITTNDSVPLF